MDIIPDTGITDHRIGPHPAILADGSASQELHKGLDRRIRPDADFVINHARLWAKDGHAPAHQSTRFPHAHVGVESHKLCNGVTAEYLVRSLGANSQDLLPFRHE